VVKQTYLDLDNTAVAIMNNGLSFGYFAEFACGQVIVDIWQIGVRCMGSTPDAADHTGRRQDKTGYSRKPLPVSAQHPSDSNRHAARRTAKACFKPGKSRCRSLIVLWASAKLLIKGRVSRKDVLFDIPQEAEWRAGLVQRVSCSLSL
jgi:hypothetical protein